jgi:hypothetical protein
MAAVRRLKKDIDFISSELIVECFTYDYLFPEKSKDDLSNIVMDAIKFRNEFYGKVNKARKEKDQKQQAFKAIRKEINEQVETFVERLRKISN